MVSMPVSLRHRFPRLWRFVTGRFAREGYLGLHLTIGLATSLAALWLFAGILEGVLAKEPLTVVDARVLAWLQQRSTPTGVFVSRLVSDIGSPVVMTVIAIGVGVVLIVRRWWIVLMVWTAAFIGGGVIDGALKILIHRPRPAMAMAILHRASFSFPSGHAMGSLIGLGMLSYLLVMYVVPGQRTRIVVVAVAVVLVLAVGLSRLYLGVHYLSDVLGGYTAGVIWLSACISGLEVVRRHGNAMRLTAARHS